jgi:hypothetical protein
VVIAGVEAQLDRLAADDLAALHPESFFVPKAG